MKKCPLKLQALVREGGAFYRIAAGDADCIEDKCGWWNSDAHNCGIAVQTGVASQELD